MEPKEIYKTKTEPLTYNRKEFLLPDSINSCALYHAKVFESGEYMFRIHDCKTGIRLRGNLNDPAQCREAIDKLETLIDGASQMIRFILQNYPSHD